MNKINWGIISTAKIGLEKVIPAMKKGTYTNVLGISSSSKEKAQKAADSLGIPRSYGNYEDILSDPDIQAVYIPLPNNLHVDWAIKALEAGKHVLCEKPLSMDLEEAIVLREFAAKYPHLKIAEAFMYKFHPQWVKTKEIIKNGNLGEIKSVHSFFNYNNTNPDDIRNRIETGGGGLMDIGCYCISFARHIFEKEPLKVAGKLEMDERFGTDKVASAIMDFGDCTSQFTCSTQSTNYQGLIVFGTKGRLEIEFPAVPSPVEPAIIKIADNAGIENISTGPADQYTLQADAFSQAILKNTEVSYPIEDAINNMAVIDAIKLSAENGKWVKL